MPKSEVGKVDFAFACFAAIIAVDQDSLLICFLAVAPGLQNEINQGPNK
jgi:hypothetical protein